MSDDLTPLTPVQGKQFYEYNCSKCGRRARNSYVEPTCTRLLENRLCFTCDFWEQQRLDLQENHKYKTIIGGSLYILGTRREGNFRGMGGRRFDIEYIEPSVNAGICITTYDLWYGSEMPGDLKEQFPDTARFLGDAGKVNVDGITCFNQSDSTAPERESPKVLILK